MVIDDDFEAMAVLPFKRASKCWNVIWSPLTSGRKSPQKSHKCVDDCWRQRTCTVSSMAFSKVIHNFYWLLQYFSLQRKDFIPKYNSTTRENIYVGVLLNILWMKSLHFWTKNLSYRLSFDTVLLIWFHFAPTMTLLEKVLGKGAIWNNGCFILKQNIISLLRYFKPLITEPTVFILIVSFARCTAFINI